MNKLITILFILVLIFDTQAAMLELGRLKYGGGGDWYNDPEVLPNLARELVRRTGMDVSVTERVIELSDPELFSFPFLYMTGHGNVRFEPNEAERLRKYLERGGFLYVDDDYGMDQHFRNALGQVFPGLEMLPISPDHLIYRIFYRLDGPGKVHEHDGKPPTGYGIFHKGRMVIFYTHESNISDGWADPATHGDPAEVRETSFRMGVNIVLYAILGAE
ncbi:MAG: DUF4159 domain-containing protein [Candidatus Wallbacteria bacterium]|nr:DUF4159 domain-containing protein [Candidatus Wallbacteria bacterium]